MNTGAPPVEPSPTASTTPEPETATEPTAPQGPRATPVHTADSEDGTLPSAEPNIPRAEGEVTIEPVTVRLIDPPPDPAAADAAPVAEKSNPEPMDGAAATTDSTDEPTPHTSPWVSASPAGERVAFCFNLAKLAGQGEDADPILRGARDVGLVAVFDGMGGAGGTTYPTTDGPRTGAYLASRAVRDVVERRMLDLFPAEDDPPGSAIAEKLHDSIEQALRARLVSLQTPPSMLRSKLLRALPTTMALAAVHRHASVDGSWECDLLWAGDSRIYLLRPRSGLAQLTTDDIRDQGDAMTNLRQDSVISNAISADTAFVVNHRRLQLRTPFLIIAATDGCFGYLPSPMHFEWLLLSTLQTALDPESWSAQLQARITAVSGDDSSMAVLGIGSDHQGFQSLLTERTTDLETRWVMPLEQLDGQVSDLERQLDQLRRRQAQQTTELWTAYRADYERYLAAGAPETSAS